MKIIYLSGDATYPERVASGPAIITHICNDVGAWGAGFVMAISLRWKKPEQEYQRWHRTGGCELGKVQFVLVDDNITVANMIGQRDIRTKGKVPPIRYGAVSKCLARVAAHAMDIGATVHMPRIGCGLAGGSWNHIEPLIQETLLKLNVPVYVYDKQ